MARWARCTLQEITVATANYGRRMSAGALVDLDEMIGPGVRLADALGQHAARFVPVTADDQDVSAPDADHEE
jgi:putative salt-induced outer membrane protein YdiY